MKLKIMLLFVAIALVMMTAAAPAYAVSRILPGKACNPGQADFGAPPIFEFGGQCHLVSRE
jgi:hypothetical protein